MDLSKEVSKFLKREHSARHVLFGGTTGSQEIDCFDAGGGEAKSEYKLLLNMEILSGEKLRHFPAGLGRGFPNENPHLPPPATSYSIPPLQFEEQMKGISIFSLSHSLFFLLGFIMLLLSVFAMVKCM